MAIIVKDTYSGQKLCTAANFNEAARLLKRSKVTKDTPIFVDCGCYSFSTTLDKLAKMDNV